MQHRSRAEARSRAKERTLALVLAGGRGSRLRELTRRCTKPAVPFGGQYRIVDFTLSNCVNSGLRNIALLTQYKSQSLIRHVSRSWQAAGAGYADSIEIWPAQQRLDERWYAGTADAVRQNADLILESDPDNVLILAGDHIYAMDYVPMLEQHLRRDADATVCCTRCPASEAHALGIIEVDGRMRLESFTEKPDRPAARAGGDGVLASMGVYVFKTAFLLECLEEDARVPGSEHDFGYSILPRIISQTDVYAHVFGDSGDGTGYWRDVGTVESYWSAHMDLLSETPRLDLDDDFWPIRPGEPQAAPAALDATASVRASRLGAGSYVAGEVYRCILSARCTVGAGSRVTDSVLLPNVTIGRNCIVNKAVIDTGCHIPDNTIVSGSGRGAGARDRIALVIESPPLDAPAEPAYETA